MSPLQNGTITETTNDTSSTMIKRSNKVIVSTIALLTESLIKVINYLHQELIDRPNKNPYDTKPGEKPYKLEIVWFNVFAFIYLHAAVVYAFTLPIKTSSFVFGEFEEECFSVSLLNFDDVI